MSAQRKTDIQIGNRYGHLVVVDIRRRPRPNGYADAQSYCRCDCGKLSWISDTRLRQGREECRSCTTKRAWQKIPRLSPVEIDLRIRQKSYHQGALKRNLPWQLSREEFRKLLADSCLYCGLTPSNGVDRRDNSKGYTHENSVPCCAQCNYAKRHQTEAEFLNWVSRIAAKQGFSL